MSTSHEQHGEMRNVILKRWLGQRIGGKYEVIHHTELIDELIASGSLQELVGDRSDKITFHDPCYLGRQNGVTIAPRDVLAASGTELIEAIASSFDRYGTSETIVVTRSNKRANKFNAGIRSQILWREEHISPGDLLMVVKNNYFWKDVENRLDFIANGDIIRIERVISTEEVHGRSFANVLVSLPDYPPLEMEVKLLLDVIEMETPSLDYEQQRALYQSVAEDYPEAINRKQVSEKLSLDPYYNALQVKFAYAITCHKSQGGQWKSVFLDQGYFTEEMLSLEYLRWLYTAFTRASEQLCLVNLAKAFVPEESG